MAAFWASLIFVVLAEMGDKTRFLAIRNVPDPSLEYDRGFLMESHFAMYLRYSTPHPDPAHPQGAPRIPSRGSARSEGIPESRDLQLPGGDA
jgi:hypothetical protein